MEAIQSLLQSEYGAEVAASLVGLLGSAVVYFVVRFINNFERELIANREQDARRDRRISKLEQDHAELRGYVAGQHDRHE